MTCISPPELDDSELLRYVDGEADRSVLDHLGRCEYCRGRAQEIARIHNRLSARLFRLTCPQPLELGEYHLGLLDRTRAAEIGRHLRECPHCSREVAQLRSYLAELAPTIEFSPAQRLEILVARIVSGIPGARPPEESAFAPAFAALRGEGKGPITFEADGILIVLDVQPAAEGLVRILGQVAADDQDRWTGASVELRQAGMLQMAATVDDLGAFRFEGVLPGSTEFLITPLSGDAVLVPNVEIVV